MLGIAYYTVTARCSNCAFQNLVKIRKGKLVSEHKCPNCGNLTLSLHPEPKGIDRYR